MSKRPPTFALIGAAGFVAPRHLDAIKHVGGRVLGACDPHDAVGVLDRYGDQPAFFTEIERFDRWLDRQNRGPDPVDYVVVCSPNYLHESHARLAMRAGSRVILEKPACLTERNLDALFEVEQETGRGINCVLQLRNVELPALEDGPNDIIVAYRVRRGPWFDYSWKGDPAKSGGPLTNIGIHIIDLLCHSYADDLPDDRCFFEPIVREPRQVRGHLYLMGRVTVYIELDVSLDREPYRAIRVNGQTIDLSAHLGLHTVEYERILRGDGWDLDSARKAIRICEEVR